MARAKVVTYKSHDQFVLFACPACGFNHGARIVPRPNEPDEPCYIGNGDLGRPTFDGEFKVYIPREKGVGLDLCHFVVVNGRIAFFDDSTHTLAGKTFDLGEVH